MFCKSSFCCEDQGCNAVCMLQLTTVEGGVRVCIVFVCRVVNWRSAKYYFNIAEM